VGTVKNGGVKVKVGKPKVTVPAKPVVEAPVPQSHEPDISKLLAESVTRAETLAELVEGQLAALVPGTSLGQSVLQTFKAMDDIQTRLDKASKKLWPALLSFCKGDGTFAPGKLAVQISVSTSRRPEWKEEATKQAGEVAKLKSEPFTAEVYQESVRQATPEKPSESANIVEVKVAV